MSKSQKDLTELLLNNDIEEQEEDQKDEEKEEQDEQEEEQEEEQDEQEEEQDEQDEQKDEEKEVTKVVEEDKKDDDIETMKWGDLLIDTQPKPETEKEPEITEVLKTDMTTLDDIQNLRNSCFVAGYLRKLIKNSLDNKTTDEEKTLQDTELFAKYLKWMAKISLLLANKNKQTITKHNYSGEKMENIPRSSFKFCFYGPSCKFYYHNLNNEGCYAQHFPYNNIYADIVSLITHIDINKESSNLSQIIICMNTIYFVFHHMCNELSLKKTKVIKIREEQSKNEDGWTTVKNKKPKKIYKII